MAGGHPGLRIHQNGAVESDVGVAFLDELFPPGALDVVFELGPERAVVPCVGQAAVDFGAWEYIAAPLAQRHNFVHGLFGIFHHADLPPIPHPAGERLLFYTPKYSTTGEKGMSIQNRLLGENRRRIFPGRADVRTEYRKNSEKPLDNRHVYDTIGRCSFESIFTGL